MPPWTRSRRDRSADGTEGGLVKVASESNVQAIASRDNSATRQSVVSFDAARCRRNPPSDEIPPVPHLEVPDDVGQPRTQRFSLLRFRHASDSQLGQTAKEHAHYDDAAPPSIITTAPTQENFDVSKRKSALLMPKVGRAVQKKKSQKSIRNQREYHSATSTPNRVTFEEAERLQGLPAMPPVIPQAPPPYGDEASSALALPVSRVSESSRSDESSNDHRVYAATTTTTVSTTTTFFRLPRRKKNKGPLFPLPPKTSLDPPNPRFSSGRHSESPQRKSTNEPPEMNGHSSEHSPVRRSAAGRLFRSGSRASHSSQNSNRQNNTRPGMGERGRSSTISSLKKPFEDDDLPTPPVPQSTRTSTSTAGRPSLAGLFNMSRLKQPSDHNFARHSGGPGTPGSTDSRNAAFIINAQKEKEISLIVPERQEGDTPAKYLSRLEGVVHKGALVALLAKHDDEFSRNVMRSYMRRFKFFEDPLDIAVRKMLMQVELPKETQQIDRTLQSFADRYHECNPGIFSSPDEAYFVAFSILILHTDAFNKNNKRKMQKPDYVKNAQTQNEVAADILECFYDNICYTPFIHLEDDLDVSSERLSTQKSRRNIKVPGPPSMRKTSSGPLDPYTLILDGKIDTLRPALNEYIATEDCFHYLSGTGKMNLGELSRTFFKSGVLQIVSSRSRPGAFANQATITNPQEAQVGVVDMKVAKVGVLWRKDPKKKKTRSPWQEWGAVLTGSQLYFFRNTSWVKNLMHQLEYHQKHGRPGTACIFKPQLDQFKPDYNVSIENAVALIDSTYKKHKNAFMFTRQTAFAEIFLADSETDLNDWMAKLNYASTFRTSGVRMRGVKSGAVSRKSRIIEDPESARASGQYDRNESLGSDEELARQIVVARREMMAKKIEEYNDKVVTIEKQLDALLRTQRHLQILTPIQNKTREDVVLAAVRYATNIRWSRIEMWRYICHRDLLTMELEDDMREGQGLSDAEKNGITPQMTKESSQSRPNFGRFNSKKSDGKGRMPHPAAGGKLFSMDDIFKTPSRLKSQNHRPKGSWELPPINFDRRPSNTTSGTSVHSESHEVEASDDDALSPTSHDPSRPPLPLISPAKTIRPEQQEGKAESEAAEAAISPTATRPAAAKDSDVPTPTDESASSGDEEEQQQQQDKFKLPSLDDKDGMSKVRHSFQRKLHQHGHLPTHRGSKKGKDQAPSQSASSVPSSHQSGASGSEDNADPLPRHSHSQHGGHHHNHLHNHHLHPHVSRESEGLARGEGSFTLHGKKASIVTFGSEWQTLSGEEQLKRARPQSLVSRSNTRDTLEEEEDTGAGAKDGEEAAGGGSSSGKAAAKKDKKDKKSPQQPKKKNSGSERGGSKDDGGRRGRWARVVAETDTAEQSPQRFFSAAEGAGFSPSPEDSDAERSFHSLESVEGTT